MGILGLFSLGVERKRTRIKAIRHNRIGDLAEEMALEGPLISLSLRRGKRSVLHLRIIGLKTWKAGT